MGGWRATKRACLTSTCTALHQQEDTEGYLNRHYRISIRYDVAGRSYEAEGFQELVDYAVGSEVSIRYRRNNPQDVHLGYWSSLWSLAVATALAVSFAWFMVN